MHYMGEKVEHPDDFLSIAIGDIDFFKKSVTLHIKARKNIIER